MYFCNGLKVSREKAAMSNTLELTGERKGVKSKIKLDPDMKLFNL